MNMKTWIPLGLAAVLGVVAMFIAKDMLGKKADEPQAVGNLASIVVAKGRIEPGKTLKADDLTLVQVATNTVPDGAFTEVTQAVGRTTLIAMGARQPVLNSLLAADGAGTGIQALIPNNMRAITIEVNEFSGLAGMILPGVSVDVVATVQGEENGNMASHTIVQNVKVLAVGQQISPETPVTKDGQPEPFRNVTLVVKPEQAEAIQLATQTSRPWLMLRSGKDDAIVKSNGVSVQDLRGKNGRRGDSDPFAIPVADFLLSSTKGANSPTTQPAERRVKMIRGGQESEVVVPDALAAPSELMTSTNSESNR